MPQEPKRRHSKGRKGKRRASIHLTNPESMVCPNCKSVTLPHMVCKKCGFYEREKIITIKTKKTKEEQSKTT